VDKIFENWLDAQHEQGAALSQSSDVLELTPVHRQLFLARFHCRGLVQEVGGGVREVDLFEVGYRFADDYLRRVNPSEVVTWLRPGNVFHPNIMPPLCCLGNITPGTSLVELIYRTYEVISYQNVMPDERDALNAAACSWARRHQDRFPLDDRPLKRRGSRVNVEVVGVSE
jgi:hypothetical protein